MCTTVSGQHLVVDPCPFRVWTLTRTVICTKTDPWLITWSSATRGQVVVKQDMENKADVKYELFHLLVFYTIKYLKLINYVQRSLMSHMLKPFMVGFKFRFCNLRGLSFESVTSEVCADTEVETRGSRIINCEYNQTLNSFKHTCLQNFNYHLLSAKHVSGHNPRTEQNRILLQNSGHIWYDIWVKENVYIDKYLHIYISPQYRSFRNRNSLLRQSKNRHSITEKCDLEKPNNNIDTSLCHCTFLFSILANTHRSFNRRSSVQIINSLNFSIFGFE